MYSKIISSLFLKIIALGKSRKLIHNRNFYPYSSYSVEKADRI